MKSSVGVRARVKEGFLGVVAAAMVLFCFCGQVRARYHFDVTPALSVSEQYDDNIYLSERNEKSDYITSVSPSLNLGFRAQHTDLDLRYGPSFVFYDDQDRNDTVRHSGSLSFGRQLGRHLRMSLSDTLTRSEEPIEEAEDVEGVRSNREPYYRNNASGSLNYIFGQGDSITLGYGHAWLKNDDKTVDNGITQTPNASLTYSFNVQNSVTLTYGYTKAEFWRDEGTAGDDYTGHSAGVRYTYRFTKHTSASLGYNFSTRNFDGDTEEYKVHDGSLDFSHAFSRDFSVSMGAGYFKQDKDVSKDQKGYSYNLDFSKRIERGSLSIGGRGGWDEAYLEAERRGFSKYYSGTASADYQVLEPLKVFAGGSYRLDRQADGREWKTWSGNCGLSWSFLRWFSLSLTYTYRQRDDDIDTDDYEVNQVMLTLSGSRLFRW
ncbi:MAG: outer membrane beta-barrel protein [Deltaproteobacteria bacterium]|nr:outer membrane beta-barrel protein [Deltaproteobacteria bacterium]